MNTWASLFRQWGYATLVLDSFTARGVSGGICSGGSDSIRPSTRALDIYSAATILAQTTGVSPRKIGVFGVSHGAAAAGLALGDDGYTSEAEAMLAAAGGKIAAGAAIYPECETALYGPAFHAPLFVAAGSADDWTSPLKCQTLTNFPTVSGTPVDLTNFGSLVRIIVYPGVTHAFDIPGPTQPVINRYGYRVAYNPAVTADVQARIRAFFDSYIR
jgi:dienelactone hydrolase